MNLFQKIKAAIVAKRLVNQMGEIKRGWKSWSFWIAVIANLLALGAALQGVLPPVIALIAMTVLAALYNIFRGIVKSEEGGVRAWYKTTEFWLGVGTEIAKAILALQNGGINPAWFATTSTVLAGVMTLARDLSHLQPAPPQIPVNGRD